MSITSIVFLIFIAITLVVYYFCIPKKYQWCVLLAASYVFYAFSDFRLFFFILSTTFTVFFSALWIAKITGSALVERKDKAWYLRIPKKTVLALIAILNFGVLVSFKWWNNLAEVLNSILSRSASVSFRLPLNRLLLPLGISYYTFQAVGYLVDVYRNKIKPEHNPIRFALFISFFPQLVQGPISRYSELAEQLYTPRKFNYVEFRRGFQLMIWGLFTKMVIADRLVLMVDEIFGTPEKYKGLYIVVGIIAQSFWMYTEFMGGIDIMRGVGQMFGIIMPINFKRPYFATSLAEFWRRWHISLNDWWRDYLFYPIVLSKPMTKIRRFVSRINPLAGKTIGIYIGLNLVRLINAMWHGANKYYIAFGLSFGILMTLSMMFEPALVKLTRSLHIKTDSFSWKLFQIVRTFTIVSFCRIFLATKSVTAGVLSVISIVKDFNPWILNFDELFLVGLSRWDIRIVIVSLLILFVVSLLQEKGIRIRESLEKQNILFQWAVLLGGIVLVLLWGIYGIGFSASAFRYQMI